MTRFKLLFAAVVVAAIVGVTPAAQAQVSCKNSVNTPNCHVHVVGAGSSAQFISTGLGAYNLALSLKSGTQCAYHWTGTNGGFVIDNRGTTPIPLEPANVWVVWLADKDGSICPNGSGANGNIGNTHITDVWVDASVDSTVGVRSFLAQNTVANGGSGTALEIIPVAPSNRISNVLYTDNSSDVSITAGGATELPRAIGVDPTGVNAVHVNTGMTDITAADAYFATTRALTKLNTTTYAGLGYNSTTNVGTSILTSEGTGTKATPVKFALFSTDPITGQAVRAYSSVPIGAAPIVFVYNNNNDTTLLDLKTGVIGDGVTNPGGYPLANLFNGSTACNSDNAAFNPGDGTATPLHLFLREPLSGTMNTTEFNLFRTTGQTNNTQEKGVNPGTGDNPLSAKPCASSIGDRNRAIGTGEVVGSTSSSTGVLGVAHGLGYVFTSFGNLRSFGNVSATKYNYLTLDGVDPFGFKASVLVGTQNFVNCAGPCTAAAFWDGSDSYPTLRNGSYKAWSIYRWLVPSPDTDTAGPSVLAQYAQNVVNTTVADFVPFQACDLSDPLCGSTSPTDGLAVYRSHRTISGTYKVGTDTTNKCDTTAGDNPDCNGTATLANAHDNGNTLGFGEKGGDVGGLIEGPFGTGYTSGYITTGASVVCTANKGYKITRKTNVGDGFVPGASWENQTITIGGVNYTVSNIAVTATVLYVGRSGATCVGPVPPVNTTGLYYYIGVGGTGAAAPNGIVGKKE